MPAGLLDEVEMTCSHALRETIVRRRLLEKVLGPQWRVSSVEMLYDALNKQYAKLGEDVKKLSDAAKKIAAQIEEGLP
jgi:hypothetical protein